MPEFITVMTTTASEEAAEALAGALLEARLAACVQIMPIRSRYVWKGEVQREDELMLFVKTRADLFEKVRARIRELHSYETPEVVAVPMTDGDDDYLAWIRTETA